MRQIKESFRTVAGLFVASLVLTRRFVNRLVLTRRFVNRLAVTSFEITAVVLVQTGLSQPIELIPRMIGLIGCSAWKKSLITAAILPQVFADLPLPLAQRPATEMVELPASALHEIGYRLLGKQLLRCANRSTQFSYDNAGSLVRQDYPLTKAVPTC